GQAAGELVEVNEGRVSDQLGDVVRDLHGTAVGTEEGDSARVGATGGLTGGLTGWKVGGVGGRDASGCGGGPEMGKLFPLARSALRPRCACDTARLKRNAEPDRWLRRPPSLPPKTLGMLALWHGGSFARGYF